MKSIKSQASNVITVFAVAVVLISLIALGMTALRFYGIKERVTGFAASYGYVNITIASSINLVVYNDTINWSSGYITSLAPGQYKYANLSTNNDGNATIINGNWSAAGGDTAKPQAITVANEGNVNCSLSIQSAKNAAEFFGSTSAANQSYQWNVTEKEADACGGKNLTTFYLWRNFNKSLQNICSDLSYLSGTNKLYLNVRLQVPYDATVFGNNNDTITITCS